MTAITHPARPSIEHLEHAEHEAWQRWAASKHDPYQSMDRVRQNFQLALDATQAVLDRQTER